MPLQQLAHEPQRSSLVPARLHEHVQDLALAVNGSPEVHAAALDRDHNLVQVPSVRGSRSQLAQTPGNDWTELDHPPADGLV
jgi:hypothetical protein